jgi:hypothetical protein
MSQMKRNMKKTIIRNWKTIKSGLPLSNALEILKSQTCEGFGDGPFAIRFTGRSRIITFFSPNEQFYPQDCMEEKWEILVPDLEEETRLTEIREEFVKCNCYFQEIPKAKINHMNLEEIWDKAIDLRLNDDLRYRLLKYFFQEELYKRKKK